MNKNRSSMQFLRDAREKGFSLISAIFILVALAVLGVAMLTVSSSQQRGAVDDLLGTHAYQAARAGMEWGMYQVNSSNNWNYASPNTRTCPGGSGSYNSFTLPASATTLSRFTVTVQCTAIADPGGNGGSTVYQINSVACNAPVAGWSATSQACPGTLGINYIERYVRVLM